MISLNPNELTEKHLYKKISLQTPFEKINGVLTDFYGSLGDEDEDIVIIEIDDEPFVCSEEDVVEIG
jgi:hypothetical protein